MNVFVQATEFVYFVMTALATRTVSYLLKPLTTSLQREVLLSTLYKHRNRGSEGSSHSVQSHRARKKEDRHEPSSV